MAVSSGKAGLSASGRPDGGTRQGTATPLLAPMAFNGGRSEQRDDAHPCLIPARLWAEEGPKDLNFGVH